MKGKLEMNETLELDDENTQIFMNVGFEASQATLVKALSYVQNVVEKKNIIPILGNVKLEFVDGFLAITATDMDIEISEKVAVDVISENLAFTVPAHTFYEIIKKMPSHASVKVALQENGLLEISAENCSFTLPVLPISEFPTMDYGQLEISFHLSIKDLKKMIDMTRFSICNEETRYNLNGVYFHKKVKNDEMLLKVAATDGHRLSSCWVPLPKNAEEMPAVIVPKKTIFELKKILDDLSISDPESSVEISVSESKILFYFGNLLVASKLIDANFPDYENHIPTEHDKIVEIDVDLLKNALDRVAIVSFHKTKGVKFSLSHDALTLLAASENVGGKGNEILKVEYENEPIEIGFNSRYLLEILSTFSRGEIELYFSDKISPMILKQPNESDDLRGFVHVVMPVRV